MFLQSHTDEIVLLPALPEAWRTGSIDGLCARGGFEVDIAWEDGILTEARLSSQTARSCTVRYRDTKRHLDMGAEETVSLTGITLR